jgi:KipI family sensor histidine kinase inhibitor
MTDDFTITPEVLPFGSDGVIVRFAREPCPEAMAAVQSLTADIKRNPPIGVIEVAPALVTVLLRFDAKQTERAILSRNLLILSRSIAAKPRPMPEPARRWTIPATFGGANGPQLDEVAALLGCKSEEAVRQLCESELRVLAIGFTPGQPYIGLLPEAWNLPRMAALNHAVPAGAILVAVRQITMYSATGITGWRHVGCSGFRSFLPGRTPATLLRQGDVIRYRPVSTSELSGLTEAADGLCGARLELLR